MPRLACNDARLLIFSGDDRFSFLDGLSTNKIDFANIEIISTLVLDTKAKIIAQLHLFMLGEMLVAVVLAENDQELIDHLNSKILTQDVSINDVTDLNYVDLIYNQNPVVKAVTSKDGYTLIQINRMYSFEIYSNKLKRKQFSNDWINFHDWRINQLIPWHGYEVTRKVNPYQCGLDGQVHENKGCFTGQEVLTRMRSRNKGMCQLTAVDNNSIMNHNVSTKGTHKSIVIERV